MSPKRAHDALACVVELNFFPDWEHQPSLKTAVFAQKNLNFLFALIDLISNRSYSA